MSCFLSVLGTCVPFIHGGPWEHLSSGGIHSLTHSFRMTVCVNGCPLNECTHSRPSIHPDSHSHSPIHTESPSGQINCCELSHSHQLIHTDSYSHTSIHHTVIPTKPAEGGIKPMSSEQIGNSSITCATETPTTTW